MKIIKYILIILATVTFIACSNKDQPDRHSTMQSNVTVLAQKFTINRLNRDRQIRIYLPEDYEESEEVYPVLYMHDGQNLFDDSTSYVGEWGVDENLNQLAKDGGLKLIVVGIDNGQEKRMNELSPWENEEYGKAEGVEYMEFIVKQLKPFIDSTYRTLSDRDNTAIMGSSMGGLISHYAIYNYPEVFGKAVIFSPSYWYSKDVFTFTESNPVPHDARMWLEIGSKEGNAVDDVEEMYDHILATGHPSENLYMVIDPEGEHNESSWRKQFTPAISWLFQQNSYNN